MEASVVKHKLDLFVRVIDTTTGLAVEEKNVDFSTEEKFIQPVYKGNGGYICLNTGRNDFTLNVKADGYEEASVLVKYGELDAHIPVKEIFLIPSEDNPKGEKILTLSGSLEGLEAIEAVISGQAISSLMNLDGQENIIKLINKNGLAMEDVYYGIIYEEENKRKYEPFEIVENISQSSVRIKKTLKKQFSVNAPITRIIYGDVKSDGTYLLRVRDNMQQLEAVVRYVVRGKIKYKVVDFHNLKDTVLE